MEPNPDHTTPPEAAARPPTPSSNGHDPSAGEALKKAAQQIGELKEYAGLYVSAKLDSLKLTMRNLVLYAALGLVGAIVGIGLLITAAALFLTGIAGGIGAIFDPDRYWVGALIVGFVVLAGAMGGLIVVIRKLTGASKQQTIQKYEERKRDERNRYGHDVQERAREQAQQQPEKHQANA
jgi:ABC-type transport system involved in cytochrome bd biosynthesis fused ATPase/permease subunit